MAWSQDHQLCAWIDECAVLRIVDRSGTDVGHMGVCCRETPLAWGPKHTLIIGDNQDLVVWRPGQLLRTVARHGHPISDVAWGVVPSREGGDDQHTIAVSTDVGNVSTVTVFTVDTRDPDVDLTRLQEVEVEHQGGCHTALQWSPRGALAAAYGGNMVDVIPRLGDPQVITACLPGGDGPAALCWNRSGTRLAVGTELGLWWLTPGEKVIEVQQLRTGPARRLAWSDRGLAVYGDRVEIWCEGVLSSEATLADEPLVLEWMDGGLMALCTDGSIQRVKIESDMDLVQDASQAAQT